MRHDRKVKLRGRTGLAVTRLGFGATAIGGMYEEVADAQGQATVDAAWNSGIRLFDAAPQYSLGLGERRLGEGLAGRPRDEYVLSTKVGRLLRAEAAPNPDDFGPDGEPFDKGTPAVATVYDYSRDGVLASIEESLARLKQDRLDIVYVHDPDNYVREALDGAFPALIELREQGVRSARWEGMNQYRRSKRSPGTAILTCSSSQASTRCSSRSRSTPSCRYAWSGASPWSSAAPTTAGSSPTRVPARTSTSCPGPAGTDQPGAATPGRVPEARRGPEGGRGSVPCRPIRRSRRS